MRRACSIGSRGAVGDILVATSFEGALDLAAWVQLADMQAKEATAGYKGPRRSAHSTFVVEQLSDCRVG